MSIVELLNVEAALAMVRRQWKIVAVCFTVSVVAGMIFITTAAPRYTSSATVLMDRGSKQLVNDLSLVAGVLDDEGSVLSQVEVIKSEVVALRVVDKLNLIDDAVFNAQSTSVFNYIRTLVRQILSVFPWAASSSPVEDDRERRRQAAAASLENGIDVDRVGRSYVLEISYETVSPDLAAKIVNATAEAYIDDKLNSRYEATRRASAWLVDRIAELREKSLDTDLAVQKFRSANGLVTTGSGSVSDQQLSELNTALIGAQSDVAKTQARLQRIRQILDTGQTDAIVTDVLDSSISNELRTKYLNASRLEAQISSRLGPNHVQAVRLRGEMNEYKRLMFDELGRIAQGYQSEVDVALARQRSLEKSVIDATSVSATANETKVQLRELEREAETYRNLYQTFLQRYQEAVQQQSFPVTDARVITRGAASGLPTYPKKPSALALFAILGIAVGAGASLLREYRERFFRTSDQIRDVLGIEFLGNIAIMAREDQHSKAGINDTQPSLWLDSEVVSHAVLHPYSAMAETLRNCKIAADFTARSRGCKIVGIISALPGEGKSTVAINLATLLAGQGNRTVLIDSDLRNPGASRALTVQPNMGIVEVLLGEASASGCLLTDRLSGLRFLPSAMRNKVPHSAELLNSAAMGKLLHDLSEEADYIILDLPPLGPVVDAKVIAGRVDNFIMVVEWGKTARRFVKDTLLQNHSVHEKCAGIVLNKVDQSKMRLYQSYGSGDYYRDKYSSYYQYVA